MPDNNLSLKEIEKLGYYDFMSYVGTPFFHVGGLKSSLELAGLCRIKSASKVLIVGCGSGLSACFLAKKLKCHVIGLDIAEVSIKKAKERAKRELLEDQAEFLTGSAYGLPFEAETFDAVITEFVSQSLNQTRAFEEFVRVLKPSGYVGINELFKKQNIPSNIAEEILSAQRLVQEATGLEFNIYSKDDWSAWLEKSGLKKVQVNEYSKYVKIDELPEYNDQISINELPEYNDYITIKELPRIFAVGKNLIKIISLKHNRKMFKYLILSQIIRNRYKKIRTFKAVLFRNKTTSGYVGCVLGIGQKG